MTNEKDARITLLESTLAEEREKVSHFLDITDSYARGLLMMADAAYVVTTVGTPEDANAKAIRQHAADLEKWMKVRGNELRSLMRREIPCDIEEAPEPPEPPLEAVQEEAAPDAMTIH